MKIPLPQISIITPSFNQGKYIEDAIKSVLIQKYPNIEHIIIDNCSTDNTLEILKKYSHLNWISETDKGQSNALNKGFRMASGDILGWLNADDFYLPDGFHKIVKIFKNFTDTDIVYGNWYFVDENGKEIKKFQTIPYSHKSIIYYGPYIGSTALFFRRNIIDEGLFIDERFKYAMDWEWYARLGRYKKKFVFINSDLAGFRVHGENQSLKFGRMNNMDKFFLRAQQLAEGYAIKRCYGFQITKGNNGSLFEDICFRFLWWYHHCVVILKKSYFLIKSEPKHLKSYIKKRKIELTN